jgi:hypothetical protein
MAIDKSLYQAPQGMPADAEGDPDIEIEIENPDAVHIGLDGMEIDIEPEGDSDFDANLAEEMDEGELESLGAELSGDIDNDLNSRADWEKMYKDGITLLGLKFEERVEPWDGACGVFHPMITEAVVRFQSETIMETFPAGGPVKAAIIGKDTPEKIDAAHRVEEDMNYQLTEKMPEFRNEHERMLWNLPSAGSAFKKVYYDPSIARQISIFIPAEDIILPYGASEIASCHRVTHRMHKTKNELTRLMYAGFYRDIDVGEPQKFRTEIQEKKDKETGFTATHDERFELFECHVDLDLPGYEDKDDSGEPTGIALPYVVTMVRGTNKILSVRRNWKESDELKLKRQHFVHYQYIPGYGAYGFGLFHLIGGFAKSATSILRQLVDAGTLSNLPGGLKSRGLRIKGDDTPIAPGEFRDVDVGSGSIRDNILPLPYKEPSAVLAGLMDKIIDEGRRFASTSDMQVSDMSANAPVGTTLAILERTLKVMSAVQARVHYALRQELKLIAGIIRDYTDEEYNYEPEEGPVTAKKSDYSLVDVLPVSDPNAATLSQRVVQYQAVIQLAQSAPQIYNLPQLHRQMLDVIGIKNADKLVPLEDDHKPQDPVTENMGVLKGKPVKAFMYQDHESHIKVHQMAMEDPLIQQMIGQNPQAQAIQSAMMSHIAEHLGYAYRQKIEAAMGAPLPDPEDTIPQNLEVQISQLIAKAAPQVLAQSQSLVAQQQAQKNSQDPVMQAQLIDQQVKQGELERKKAKDLADNAFREQELELKAAELHSRKVQAAVGVATDFIDKHQQHQLQDKQATSQGLLNLADMAQKDKHKKIDVAADLFKHQTGLLHQGEQTDKQVAAQQNKPQGGSTE